MIKHRLLLAALVLAGALASCAPAARQVNVEIGDRPYYHGQTYWENDWEMVWVPGHGSDRDHAWIHGHYTRGQHRPDQKHDKVQDDRDRHDDHQFDDPHRHHRPRGS
jgi:hypothetical protein